MLRYTTDRARPGLVALYDIRPGNGAGQFLQPRSPHGAVRKGKPLIDRSRMDFGAHFSKVFTAGERPETECQCFHQCTEEILLQYYVNRTDYDHVVLMLVCSGQPLPDNVQTYRRERLAIDELHSI